MTKKIKVIIVSFVIILLVVGVTSCIIVYNYAGKKTVVLKVQAQVVTAKIA